MEPSSQDISRFSCLKEDAIHLILDHLLPEDWKHLRLVNRFFRPVIDEHITAINLKVLPAQDRELALQHLRIHSHRWPQLKKLTATGWSRSLEHQEDRMSHAVWDKLEEIYLDDGDCYVTGEPRYATFDVATFIKDAQHWPHLRILDLNEVGVGVKELSSLATMAWPCLEILSLKGNFLDDIYPRLDSGAAEKSFAKLFANCPVLKHLDLNDIGLTNTWLEALLDRGAPKLESVHLSENYFDSQAGQLLAKNSHKWPNLKSLDLADIRLRDNGLVELSKAQFPNLNTLILANRRDPHDYESLGFNNLLRKEGLGALCETTSMWRNTIKVLDLTSALHEGSDLGALFKKPWNALVELCLLGNKFNHTFDMDDAAEELALANHNGHLPALNILNLDDCGVGSIAMDTLLEYEWASLQELHLTENEIEVPEASVLAENAITLPALKVLYLDKKDDYYAYHDEIIDDSSIQANALSLIFKAEWRSLEKILIGDGAMEVTIDASARKIGTKRRNANPKLNLVWD